MWYDSSIEKEVMIMARYKTHKRPNKNRFSKRIWKKIAIIGAVGVIGVTPVVKEVKEYEKVKQIEENAEVKVPRSFKNINQENMGEYLKNQIDILYEKYPELDKWMYEDSSETEDFEFIRDVYRLYKAYMVDKAGKEVESIENVKVTVVDQIILNSDLIEEKKADGKDKKITKTHKEQYKTITNTYLAAKHDKSNGAQLGKEIYELLALELGLNPNVIASKEMAKEIEEKGFYYDINNNVFYTEKGEAQLVQKSEEKEEVQESTSEKTNLESEGMEH